jgi:hypothetical protein
VSNEPVSVYLHHHVREVVREHGLPQRRVAHTLQLCFSVDYGHLIGDEIDRRYGTCVTRTASGTGEELFENALDFRTASGDLSERIHDHGTGENKAISASTSPAFQAAS